MISERTQLASRDLVANSIPKRLALVDLSNEGLGRAGLSRDRPRGVDLTVIGPPGRRSGIMML